MAMVSRNVPPRWAVTTIMPALGGASRMRCHSSSEKSDFAVIASPIVWPLRTLVANTVATGFTDRRTDGLLPGCYQRGDNGVRADASGRRRQPRVSFVGNWGAAPALLRRPPAPGMMA